MEIATEPVTFFVTDRPMMTATVSADATVADQERVMHRHRGALAWMHEARCLVCGHEYLLHAADNRVFLECTVCGHETPGWRITATAARRRS